MSINHKAILVISRPGTIQVKPDGVSLNHILELSMFRTRAVEPPVL